VTTLSRGRKEGEEDDRPGEVLIYGRQSLNKNTILNFP